MNPFAKMFVSSFAKCVLQVFAEYIPQSYRNGTQKCKVFAASLQKLMVRFKTFAETIQQTLWEMLHTVCNSWQIPCIQFANIQQTVCKYCANLQILSKYLQIHCEVRTFSANFCKYLASWHFCYLPLRGTICSLSSLGKEIENLNEEMTREKLEMEKVWRNICSWNPDFSGNW